MNPAPSSRLTICGIAELCDFRDASVTHVLSILDPDRAEPEDFTQYAPHTRLTLRFDDIIAPAPGQIMPEREHIDALLRFGRGLAGDTSREAGGDPLCHLLVHCHMGISRSTAAMTILLAEARPQAEADAVIEAVHGIREKAWPNLRMVTLADEMLGRQGRLVAAAGRLYARQLATRPELEEFMRGAGRDAEIELARES